MAERLGIPQPIVSDNYERGELRLHGELIVKLAGILGVSADDLLGLEERKANSTIKNVDQAVTTGPSYRSGLLGFIERRLVELAHDPQPDMDTVAALIFQRARLRAAEHLPLV